MNLIANSKNVIRLKYRRNSIRLKYRRNSIRLKYRRNRTGKTNIRLNGK